MTPSMHRHLDESALWALAESEALAAALAAGAVESLAAWREASELPSPEARAEISACPHCSARLNQAVTQLTSLRKLPVLQTPPDFLAQVQARLQERPSRWAFWKSRIGEWLAPGHGGRLPVGLASAGLLVVLLIWVMPRQSEKEFPPAPVVAFEERSKPNTPKDLKDESAQPAQETQPRQLGKTDARKADSKGVIPSRSSSSPRLASKEEPSLADLPLAGNAAMPEAAPSSPSPAAVPSVASSPMVQQRDDASVPSKELAKESHEEIESKRASKLMEPMLVSKAKSMKGESDAGGLVEDKPRLRATPAFPAIDFVNAWHRQGDTLRGKVPGVKRQALEKALDSLGYSGKYRILVQGDSLELLVFPVP